MLHYLIVYFVTTFCSELFINIIIYCIYLLEAILFSASCLRIVKKCYFVLILYWPHFLIRGYWHNYGIMKHIYPWIRVKNYLSKILGVKWDLRSKWISSHNWILSVILKIFNNVSSFSRYFHILKPQHSLLTRNYGHGNRDQEINKNFAVNFNFCNDGFSSNGNKT